MCKDTQVRMLLIKVPKNAQPDAEAMQDAFQLAIAYSKAKDKSEAEILVTQAKFVTRYGKGQPGKVHVSKHKVFHAKFDPKRFQNLKEREKPK